MKRISSSLPYDVLLFAGRFSVAAKIRHCLAQHAIDRGAPASVKIVLQLVDPAPHHLDRRTDRLGGDDAFDADIRAALLA